MQAASATHRDRKLLAANELFETLLWDEGEKVRCRAHHHNVQEDTTGGTITSDSPPTSMVVLSALAPKDRVFDGVMSLPSVKRHFRRAVGEVASSKWPFFATREGWRCSTGSSVPLGCDVAPKRAK
jgi:hypothetical protein